MFVTNAKSRTQVGPLPAPQPQSQKNNMILLYLLLIISDNFYGKLSV